MKHLTADQLNRLLDRGAEERSLEPARRHLEGCAACREALATLAALDQSLHQALAFDPGEAYFESFAERVEARIRAESATAPLPAKRRGLGAWFASPRHLALVGAVATVVVGAGVVLLNVRNAGIQEMQSPELRGRADQVAGVEPKREAPSEGPAETPEGGSLDRSAPETAAELETEAELAPPAATPPAPAPAPSAFRERNEARSGADSPEADSPAPAKAREESSARAARVRRDARGEEVPVRTERESRFARPPAPAAEGTAKQIQKPAPQPLSPRGKQGESAPSLLRDRSGTSDEAARSLGATAAPNLCGAVRDRSGRPVAGAQVAVADLGLTTTSDGAGRFCLVVPPGDHTLAVMAVGFESARREVRVNEERTEADVTLESVVVLQGPEPRRPRALLRYPATSDFSAWPAAARGIARQASERSEQAAQSGSAARFDEASVLWERALDRVKGQPAEIEVRGRLAETRFLAWEADPSSRRRTEAVAALTAYLVRAPGGALRDSIARRLDRVKQ